MRTDHHDSPETMFTLVCALLVLLVVLLISAYNQASIEHQPTLNTLAPAVYQSPPPKGTP